MFRLQRILIQLVPYLLTSSRNHNNNNINNDKDKHCQESSIFLRNKKLMEQLLE